MDINPTDNNSNYNNNINNDDISPMKKMQLQTADKSKKESQYWIEHFKYKQSLINQLTMLKNETPEKISKISKITSFSKEQDILCDNLFKLNKLTNYSQLKLGKNFDKMKIIESNEETQKKKLKEIFEKNLETIKSIEKTSEEIDVQNKLLNSWQKTIEILKNNVSETRKENCLNIDNLCNKFSQDDKEFKKISKLYNLFCNITKYRVLNIQNDENDSQNKRVKGYLLNAKNGNILNYNIKIKNNESVENKATKVFNFWRTLVNFNQNISN